MEIELSRIFLSRGNRRGSISRGCSTKQDKKIKTQCAALVELRASNVAVTMKMQFNARYGPLPVCTPPYFFSIIVLFAKAGESKILRLMERLLPPPPGIHDASSLRKSQVNNSGRDDLFKIGTVFLKLINNSFLFFFLPLPRSIILIVFLSFLIKILNFLNRNYWTHYKFRLIYRSNKNIQYPFP